MRRIVLVAATLVLSGVSGLPSRAQETGRSGPDDAARAVAVLKRETDRLKTEISALRKQVDDLKKAQGETTAHVEMLLKHRHQLFLDFMRADAFFPKAKGTFFVVTPSPDDLTKTSGPVSGPK